MNAAVSGDSASRDEVPEGVAEGVAGRDAIGRGAGARGFVAQTLHVLRKDLQHARWLIAAWLTLIVVDLAFRVVDSGVMGVAPPHALYAARGGWLFVLSAIIVLLFASATVHDDPLPGSRAFWRTRPISASALHASKAAGLLLVVVLPGLIAVGGFLAIWGVRGDDLVVASLETLLFSLVGLSIVFAAAALSDRLAQMLLLLAVAGTLFVVVALSGPTLVRWLQPGIPRPRVLLFGRFSILPALVILAMTLAISLGTWRVYRTRRRASVLAMLLAGGAIFMVLPRVLDATLPDAWRPRRPAVAEAWAASDRLTARAQLDAFRSRELAIRGGSTEPNSEPYPVELAAPVLLDGLPDGYTATASLSNVDWRVDDHVHRQPWASAVRVTSRSGGGSRSNRLTDARPPVVTAQGVASDQSGGAGGGEESWPVLLTLTRADYQRFRTRPGRYSATAEFHVRRYETFDMQPLRAGDSAADGSRRVEIIRLVDQGGACHVDLRWIDLQFTFRSGEPRLGLQFEDAAGRPLFVFSNRGQLWRDFSLFPIAPTMAPTPLRVLFETRWLSRRDVANDPPTSDPPPEPIPCADVRWSAVRITNVGTVTRRVDIPNLVLAEWERPADASQRRRDAGADR